MPLFLSFISGAAIFQTYQFFPVASLIFSLFFFGAAAYKSRIFLIPFFFIGALYASVRIHPLPAGGAAGDEVRLTGRFLRKMPSLRGDDSLLVFAIERGFSASTGEELEWLQGNEADLRAGVEPDYDKTYEVFIRIRDRSRLNPGGYPSARLSGKMLAVGEAGFAGDSPAARFYAARLSLNRLIQERFTPQSAGLIAAITTGDTSLLDDEVRSAFSATGLTHILSISGTHFGLFSVMLFGIFVSLIKLLPHKLLLRLTVCLSLQQAAALLCIPFMVLYLGISGGGPPTVRSFIMVSLFLGGLLVGRKGFWLNSLLLAAFLLVLWDPVVLFNLSFQLSFIAVLFLGYAVEREEEEVAVGSRLSRYIRTSLLITLAASLGTAPLVAYHFHYFSLVSPLANLVASPLIGFVLVALSVASSFVFLFTGYFPLVQLIEHAAALSIRVVKLFSLVPYADVSMRAFPPVLCILFYIAFVPYLSRGRKKILLALPAIPFLAYLLFWPSGKGALRVTFLDVGQGDSAVVELPEGKTMLIDTGRTGRETAAFLRYLGRRDIDALVLSHVHPDHTGGLDYLLRTFRVKEVWDNGLIQYPAGMTPLPGLRSLQRGDVITRWGATMTVLHPYAGFYTLRGNQYSEENSGSLVFKIAGQGKTFFFAGDVEYEAEEDMTHLEPWLRSNVIKIPHHGGRSSGNPAFLRAVSPDIAVISAGRGNPFGHPSREVLDRLEGTRIFRTDLDGAVAITARNGVLTIKTYRDYALEKADSLEKEKANFRRLFETW